MVTLRTAAYTVSILAKAWKCICAHAGINGSGRGGYVTTDAIGLREVVRSAMRSGTMCTGASNLHRSPQPASVVAYEGALSPPRAQFAAAAEQHGEQAQQDAALRHEQHMQAVSPTSSPTKTGRFDRRFIMFTDSPT